MRPQVSLRVSGHESVQSVVESYESGHMSVYDSHRIILIVNSFRQQIGTNGIKPDPLAYKTPSEAGWRIEYRHHHLVILR